MRFYVNVVTIDFRKKNPQTMTWFLLFYNVGEVINVEDHPCTVVESHETIS